MSRFPLPGFVYYLIGPDGTLVGSANEWEVIEKLLGTELRP
jgi:hypothetical protein